VLLFSPNRDPCVTILSVILRMLYMDAPYYCWISYQCARGPCFRFFLVISIMIFNIFNITLVSLVFMHPFMDMFAVFDLYIWIEFEFNLLGRQQFADNTQGHSPKDAYIIMVFTLQKSYIWSKNIYVYGDVSMWFWFL